MSSTQHGSAPTVVPVSQARAELTRTIRVFRDDPSHAHPLVFGSHRVPEAVLLPYEQYEALRSASPESVKPLRALLASYRGIIERLARASNLGGVQVFGSVARGDDGPDSDIDLLVVPAPGATFFDFAQFALDVEQLTGRRVDVVSRNALSEDRDERILAEATDL